MNPSGLWRGMTESDGRIGHFKFINVEMIPQTTRERKRSDRRKRSNASSKSGTKCSSNQEVSSNQPSGYNDQNESNVESRKNLASRKASLNISVTANDNSEYDSLALRTPTNEEENSNSRPKSVEDLLRRIGLEVPYLIISSET